MFLTNSDENSFFNMINTYAENMHLAPSSTVRCACFPLRIATRQGNWQEGSVLAQGSTASKTGSELCMCACGWISRSPVLHTLWFHSYYISKWQSCSIGYRITGCQGFYGHTAARVSMRQFLCEDWAVLILIMVVVAQVCVLDRIAWSHSLSDTHIKQ